MLAQFAAEAKQTGFDRLLARTRLVGQIAHRRAVKIFRFDEFAFAALERGEAQLEKIVEVRIGVFRLILTEPGRCVISKDHAVPLSAPARVDCSAARQEREPAPKRLFVVEAFWFASDSRECLLKVMRLDESATGAGAGAFGV